MLSFTFNHFLKLHLQSTRPNAKVCSLFATICDYWNFYLWCLDQTNIAAIYQYFSVCWYFFNPIFNWYLLVFNYAVQGGCSVTPAPANFIKDKPNNQIAFHPNKRGKETEYVSVHQKLQMSLNYNMFHDDADRSVSLLNQNPVSTGLRLSFNDDDEHNSSVTSASGSMNPTPSIILSLGDNIRTELDRQNEELDQYIKFQVLFLPLL